MVLEMVFQIVSASHQSTFTPDWIAIVEIMTNRVLDGSNLSLFSLTLLYMYSFQEKYEAEDEFFIEQKVNMANKTLITLFRYFHLVLLKFTEIDLAQNFLRNIICASSEVYLENVNSISCHETELILKAKMKNNRSSLRDFAEFLESITDNKPKSKQFNAFIETLKKAYYTIAMKVGRHVKR
jgi:hypothetical protein